MIVSRSPSRRLLLDAAGFLEVNAAPDGGHRHPRRRDSLTAGFAAGMARGEGCARRHRDGVSPQAALNVTRHSLGTGDPEDDRRAAGGGDACVRSSTTSKRAGIEQPVTGHVSPDGLAALAEPAAPAEQGQQR